MISSDLIMKVLSPGHDLPESGISAHKFFAHTPSRIMERHTHSIVEMTFLIEGTMTNIINDIPLIQNPGELMIISMGSQHQLDFQDVIYFNLYLDLDRFPMELIPPDLSDILLPLLVPSPRFLHSFNRIQKITFPRPREVTYCFEQMVRNREEKRRGWQSSLLHWGTLILIESARSLAAQQPGIKKGGTEERTGDKERVGPLGQTNPILSVCRYLDLNFRQHLDLGILSETCGYETHYMCRKFREETGVTISTYLHLRRIRQAMYLLAVSNEKVTPIALACGYGDISYFNRQFKKHTRLSPGDYRRKKRSISYTEATESLSKNLKST